MSKRELAGLGHGFLGAEVDEATARPRKRNRVSYLEIQVDQDADLVDPLTVAPTTGEHASSAKSHEKARAKVAAPAGRKAFGTMAKSESLIVKLSISPIAFSDLLKRLAAPHVEPDVSAGAEVPADLDLKTTEEAIAETSPFMQQVGH